MVKGLATSVVSGLIVALIAPHVLKAISRTQVVAGRKGTPAEGFPYTWGG